MNDLRKLADQAWRTGNYHAGAALDSIPPSSCGSAASPRPEPSVGRPGEAIGRDPLPQVPRTCPVIPSAPRPSYRRASPAVGGMVGQGTWSPARLPPQDGSRG